MPFNRPSLSDLRAMVAQDIAAALPGTDPLLRFSNLGVLSQVLAGLSHLHYGYIDWVAQQAVPYTATDEFLEMWAALRNITRNPATQASGPVTFSGNAGASIPTGTALSRSDGTPCTVTAGGAIGSGGTVTVSVQINADPAGLTGAFGNCAAGTQFNLTSPIAGVQPMGTAASAFTGGADLEAYGSLRSRMLQAFQVTPQGGAGSDYITWALAVPGVTRAWVTPLGMGAGTVTVRFMMDGAESAYNGFPQGTNGVAAAETRATPATGDQLAVANAIYPLQPVTALVYAVAPTPNAVNFTLTGLTGASALLQSQIAASIAGVFQLLGAPGGTVPLSAIESAIAALPGTSGFVITSPAGNIASPVGALPVLGTVTYA